MSFLARDVYHGQSAPGSSCQVFPRFCIDDALVIIIILIAVFVAILFLFTLGLNLRALRRRSKRRSTRSLPGSIPPTYSSIGLPRDSSYKADCPRNPSLDPFHRTSPSLDGSFLLQDEYFGRVPQPDRAFAPARRDRDQAATAGQRGPSMPPFVDVSLAPLPPAYVHVPRRSVPEEVSTPAL
ncbi:hypothetical protein GGX14DRAFT_586844 [Mycena pura]|uniref:Uncharacterized protein n=1 Tax=Mycena pura TaxID=153505 RepID=A0AAD6Y4W7_9AGAR|nr:hypothetical protein GGX14DRAFT_586844 [Mycena pura]